MMVYKNPKLIGDPDKALLEQGYTPRDVATQLSVPVTTVYDRNKRLWHVDIHKAFKARIERDGIPARLLVTPEFGYWFSGLFDGEGCLLAWQDKRKSTHLSVNIASRVDDEQMLNYIQARLGGSVNPMTVVPPSRPKAVWHLGGIKDLVEVILPLFDAYPLHSKKSAEYKFWKELLVLHYYATLGGENPRHTLKVPGFKSEVERLCAKINYIRHWRPEGVEQ